MTLIANLTKCHVDFCLEEAVGNWELPMSKRVLAGLSVGVPVEDAYYSANELFVAILAIKDGKAGAEERLQEIVCNKSCDDYQRAIYTALTGRGFENMLDSLRWLVHVLMIRRRVKAWAIHSDLPVVERPTPYVVDCPGGPLPRFDPDCVLGPKFPESRVR